MISDIAFKLIIAGALAASLAGGAYGVYNHIETKGYDRGLAECAARVKKYEDNINSKIDKIEANATLLVTEGRASNEALQQGVTAILKNTKGKTLTIIKNGECLPSQGFSDTFKAVNARVNQTVSGVPK